MKYRRVMDRRTLLRGAGTVAIALPFLDAMRATSVYGAEPEPPVRCLTVCFGLGVPKEWQAPGLVGGLAPLGAIAHKLALCRGVNLDEVESNHNNHIDGGAGVFTGWAPQTTARAGGPSIDQVVLRNAYPQSPGTLINTLLMGSFFRRGSANNQATTRFVRSWADDGTPIDAHPIETPQGMFDRLFGQVGGEGDERRRRSILDTVLADYQHYQSAAGGLSTRSRARLSDHLDKIRELEQKLFSTTEYDCQVPAAPGEIPLLHGQPNDQPPTLDPSEWQTHWRAMADLFALGVQCDLYRFGSAMFQGAGDRLFLKGDYHHDGELIFSFDDQQWHHEYWHRYPSADDHIMEAHLHFIMSQTVYLLQQLDDASYLDENGRTVLDNALVLLGTELGNGNPHNYESVLHGISSANERFEVGVIHDFDGASGTDLYNTCLRALDVDEIIGDPAAFGGTLDTMLA